MVGRGARRSCGAHRSMACGGALLGLLVLGCVPDEGGSVPDRDVPAGTPLKIVEEALMSVGEREGAPTEELDRVVTPFLLPDGALVVPLSGVGALRVFGPESAFSHELGRAGEGPGEFAALSAAWPRGDTIEAFDGRLGRITRFLPDGSTEVVTLDPVAPVQAAVPGGFAEGWVLMGVEAIDPDGRDRMVVHHFARDGSHVAELTEVPGMARYTFPGGSSPRPLSPRAIAAFGNGEAYIGETLEPELRVFGEEGQDAREIRWEPMSRHAPGSTFRAVVDSAVARSGSEEREGVRSRLEAAPVPEHIATFWGLLVDEKGFIWVRPFEPFEHAAALGGLTVATGGSGGRWSIFSPAGAHLGTIEVPDDLEPTQVGHDAVVGIARDEFGVESVRVHPLVRH